MSQITKQIIKLRTIQTRPTVKYLQNKNSYQGKEEAYTTSLWKNELIETTRRREQVWGGTAASVVVEVACLVPGFRHIPLPVLACVRFLRDSAALRACMKGRLMGYELSFFF